MGNNTTVAEAAKWRKEKATHFASVTAERAIRDLHSERFNHHQIHYEHRQVFFSSICEDTRRAQADDNEGRG